MKTKILEWLANGETGISSKCMAFAALGIRAEYQYAPSDPSDFNRCLLLVERVPEIKKKFSEIAKISNEWNAVIENWDSIRQLFISEVGENWSTGESAPLTYQLMKDLGL